MNKTRYKKGFKTAMVILMLISMLVGGATFKLVDININRGVNLSQTYIGYFTVSDLIKRDIRKTSVYKDDMNDLINNDICRLAYCAGKYGIYSSDDNVFTNTIYSDINGDKYTFDDIMKISCEETGNVYAPIKKETFAYIFANNLVEEINNKYQIEDGKKEEIYNIIYNAVLNAVIKNSIEEFASDIYGRYERQGYIEYAAKIQAGDTGYSEFADMISNQTYKYADCVSKVKVTGKAMYDTQNNIPDIENIAPYACAMVTTKEELKNLKVRYRLKLNDDLIITNYASEPADNQVFEEYVYDSGDFKSDSNIVYGGDDFYSHTYSYEYEETTASYLDGTYSISEVAVGAGDNSSQYIKEGKIYILNDYVKSAKEDYEILSNMFIVALIMSILAFIGFVYSNIMLILAAGHRYGSEEVQKSIIDKWYVEIRIILEIIILGIFTGGLSIYVNGYSYTNVEAVILGTFTITITYLLIFYLALSIKRRIMLVDEGHNEYCLKNNMLLFKIIKWIKKRFEDKKATVRAAILFCIYLGLMLLGFLMGISTGSIELMIVEWIIVTVAAFLFVIKVIAEYNTITEHAKHISAGNLDAKLDISEFHYLNKSMAENINGITDGLNSAVDEKMKSERMKTDLITNVSHDIKTPLTSIINYVDLLKKEDLDNERAAEYLDILDKKSQRLKVLIEDLIEASKLSSGVATIREDEINFLELVNQTNGEFEEKFEQKNLTLISNMPKDKIMILGDGRKIFRVLENIYNNAYKYAMPNTRIYLDIKITDNSIIMEFKNISREQLNIDASELTERFVRGDLSRNTEGSGLGLSIAANIVELHHGKLEIILDGDLFKVRITLPLLIKNAKKSANSSIASENAPLDMTFNDIKEPKNEAHTTDKKDKKDMKNPQDIKFEGFTFKR